MSAGPLIPPRVQLSLPDKVVRAVVLSLAAAALIGLVYLLRFLIPPIVIGFLITYVMGPVADRLENRGLSRSKAVAICFGVVLLGLLGVVAGVWPSLESWLEAAPQQQGEQSAFEVQLEKRLDEWQSALAGRYKQVDWPAAFTKLRHVLQEQRRSLVEGLPTMALGLASQLGPVLLSLVIAFFVLLDGAAMKRAVVALVPNRYFENALVMLDRVDRQIASYLIGTALESLLVTLLLAVPLWLLGMPNALLFAIIFGVANVIPFVGPFIGASAGLFFSLLDPTAPSIGALVIVYAVVHFVDAGVINPLVMGKSLDMHPLTVLVGIFVGGTLGGVLGMLAIIPLIAVVKAIITTVAEGIENAATG